MKGNESRFSRSVASRRQRRRCFSRQPVKLEDFKLPRDFPKNLQVFLSSGFVNEYLSSSKTVSTKGTEFRRKGRDP